MEEICSVFRRLRRVEAQLTKHLYPVRIECRRYLPKMLATDQCKCLDELFRFTLLTYQ